MIRLTDDKITKPINVEINGESYILPFETQEYVYLDDSGQEKKLNLSRNKVAVDGLEYDIPSSMETDQEIYPNGSGPNIKARPGEGSDYAAHTDPVGEVRRALSDLKGTSIKIAESVKGTFDGAKEWIDSGFSSGISLNNLEGSVNQLLKNVDDFTSGISRMSGDYLASQNAEPIELPDLNGLEGTLGVDPAAKVVNAYADLGWTRNVLSNFKNILARAQKGNMPHSAKTLLKESLEFLGSNRGKTSFALVGIFSALSPFINQDYSLGIVPSPTQSQSQSQSPSLNLGTTAATGTTSSPTPTPTGTQRLERIPHTIITKHNTTLESWLLFHAILPGEGEVYISDQRNMPNIDGQLCITNLDFTEAKFYQIFPIVSQIFPHESEVIRRFGEGSRTPLKRSNHTKRDTKLFKRAPESNIRTDNEAPRYLDILSHRGPDQRNTKYLYDDRSGTGSTVYVVDGGFDTDHPELSGTLENQQVRRVESIHLPNELLASQAFPMEKLAPVGMENYDFPEVKNKRYHGHGTGIASIAAGLKRGVARKADLVMVKAGNGFKAGEDDYYSESISSPASIEEAFRFIRGDIENRNLQGKAVVNLSLAHKNLVWLLLYDNILKELGKLNVLLVVPSGNYGTEPDQDGWHMNKPQPHQLAGPDIALVIVGGVKYSGHLRPQTSVGQEGKPEIDIFALSEGVDTALTYLGFNTHAGPREYGESDGTSYASAAISGLIAYFQALEDVPRTTVAMKDPLKGLAHELHPPNQPLDPAGPSVAYDPAWIPQKIAVGYNGAADRVCDHEEPANPIFSPEPAIDEDLVAVVEPDGGTTVVNRILANLFCGLCKRDEGGNGACNKPGFLPTTTIQSTFSTQISLELTTNTKGPSVSTTDVTSTADVNPSTTPATSEKPPAPTQTELSCNGNSDGCWSPVHDNVTDMARKFCEKLGKEGPLTPEGDSKLIYWDENYPGQSGYHFTVSWESDCIGDDFDFPEGDECVHLVTQPWKKCDNHNMGGRFRLDCINFDYDVSCQAGLEQEAHRCHDFGCNTENRPVPSIESGFLCDMVREWQILNGGESGKMRPGMQSPYMELIFNSDFWDAPDLNTHDDYQKRGPWLDISVAWADGCVIHETEDAGEGCEAVVEDIFGRCDAGGVFIPYPRCVQYAVTAKNCDVGLPCRYIKEGHCYNENATDPSMWSKVMANLDGGAPYPDDLEKDCNAWNGVCGNGWPTRENFHPKLKEGNGK